MLLKLPVSLLLALILNGNKKTELTDKGGESAIEKSKEKKNNRQM